MTYAANLFRAELRAAVAEARTAEMHKSREMSELDASPRPERVARRTGAGREVVKLRFV